MPRRGIRGLSSAFVGVLAVVAVGCSRSPQEKLMKLAEDGNPRAQFSVGQLYANGEGVPKDYGQAVKWWRLAADQCEVRAQFNLGVLYAAGKGVTRDYREAEKWWRQAADHGDPNAQFNLGVLYSEGKGVAADPVQAYKWFSVVASNLSAPAREAAAKSLASVAEQMSPTQRAEAEALTREWKPGH